MPMKTQDAMFIERALCTVVTLAFAIMDAVT